MSDKNTGGPAFPQFGPQECGLESDGTPKLEYSYSEGMTLRDYYAAKALQGLCANPAVFAHNGMCGWALVNCDNDQLAHTCVELADAMLKAREL